MNMILMLVGDENRFDLLNIDLDGAKAGEDLSGRETGIDQNPRPRALSVAGVADISRISPASTAQQANP